MESISSTLLNQRLRNRIMEVLDVYTSIEDQARLGPDEVINMWEDYVDNERLKEYIEPVFTLEEQQAIKQFHNSWNKICDETPTYMPDILDLINNKNWLHLIKHAKEIYALFNKRGYLSEENEIT